MGTRENHLHWMEVDGGPKINEYYYSTNHEGVGGLHIREPLNESVFTYRWETNNVFSTMALCVLASRKLRATRRVENKLAELNSSDEDWGITTKNTSLFIAK